MVLVKAQVCSQDQDPKNGLQYGPSMDLLGINGSVDARCNITVMHAVSLRGEWEIHPTS